MAVNRTSTGNLQIFSRPFSSRVTGHRQQPLIHFLLIQYIPLASTYSCAEEGPTHWLTLNMQQCKVHTHVPPLVQHQRFVEQEEPACSSSWHHWLWREGGREGKVGRTGRRREGENKVTALKQSNGVSAPSCIQFTDMYVC